MTTLPETMRSSYPPKTYKGPLPPPYHKLLPVGDLARKNPTAWTCRPVLVEALMELDRRVQARGCEGVRITDLTRPGEVQAAARRRYETWVAAGRPEPGTGHWDARTMKQAFVAPPNQSFHQPGLAVDLDVYGMRFKDLDGDGGLSLLWDLARDLGLRPIIAQPRLDQSECWHFDLRPEPLRAVASLFLAHREEATAYRNAYGRTAEVANAALGTWYGDRQQERLVQARLLLAGRWCGAVDGRVGPKTLAALAEAGIEVTARTPAPRILGLLNEHDLGLAEIGAL